MEGLYNLGNIREIEDRTAPAYAVWELQEKYSDSILEAFIHSFDTKNLTTEEEKILHYGIQALLASGEEIQ